MTRVLCTGSDETLSRTRKLLLETAGFEVVTALGEREVRDTCQGEAFAVAVIDQSLSPDEKRRVFDLVRQCSPSTHILELHLPFSEKALPEADGWLEVPSDVPPRFVEHVAALAGQPYRRSA